MQILPFPNEIDNVSNVSNVSSNFSRVYGSSILFVAENVIDNAMLLPSTLEKFEHLS